MYLSRPDTSVDRPVRWLAAHTVVSAPAGATARVTIPVPRRAFADWRPDGRHYEPGRFDVLVGTSVADLPLTASILLDDAGPLPDDRLAR